MNFKMRIMVLGGMALYALALAACSDAALSASDDEASHGVTPAAQELAPTTEAALDPAILAASQISPEAFVRATVDLYKDGSVAMDQLPDNQAFFSASTRQLIDRVTANEGIAFDADPFCDCQDWVSLKVVSVKTAMTDETHAAVDLVMGGDSKLSQRYMLVREAGGWRIKDIVHPEYGSMIARLEAIS